MKALRLSASVLALGVMLLVGACQKSSDLAGRWNVVMPKEALDAMKAQGMTGTVDAYMEIKADGTWEMKGKAGPQDLGSQGGTWKQDDRQITFTITQIQGQAPTGVNTQPQTATLSEDGKSFSFMMMEFKKQ